MGRNLLYAVGLGLLQTAIVHFIILKAVPLSWDVRLAIAGVYFTIATLLMAKFVALQCTAVLLVPQFVSKRGRTALVGYIFLLTLTGPTENMLSNVQVLGQTLGCTQEQLKHAFKEALQAAKTPFVAMKQTLDDILGTVEATFTKVQESLMMVLKLIKRILASMKKAYDWLGDAVSICNTKEGTPFERCLHALDSAIADCQEELGPMDFLCEVTQVAKSVCYSVKLVDYFCELVVFANDQIIQEIEDRLQQFMHEMEQMFRVKVKYDHTFEFSTDSSKSLQQVSDEIKAEIYERTLVLRKTFNIFAVVSSGFFLFVFVRAFRYRSRYLTKDHFDNVYLTAEFFAIEQRRLQSNLETLLPLTRKEGRRYIPITAFRLTWREKLRIVRSATFLTFSTVQVGSQMFGDYALFWLLALIKRFMEQDVPLGGLTPLTVDVAGDGILADMLRGIVVAFEPIMHGNFIDPSKCVPEASPPNFRRYAAVVALLTLCWLFAVFEPYGLRVRQTIMAHFYPTRTQQRAVWLYNDILLRRESLLTLLRLKVTGKLGDASAGRPPGDVTLLDALRAKTNRIWLCRLLLGASSTARCLLCGSGQSTVHCATLRCRGLYCADCVCETLNRCSICLQPLLDDDAALDDEEFYERDSSDAGSTASFHVVTATRKDGG